MNLLRALLLSTFVLQFTSADDVFCPSLPSSKSSGNDDKYSLVWSDEFDYDGYPNPDKWGYETGDDGWGNDELEYYTDRIENSYVKNGNLVIIAKKEKYEDANYTSARLITANKGDWYSICLYIKKMGLNIYLFRTYGRFYARAKLPATKGN